MRYIKFSGGNGYCGCDFEKYLCVEDGYLDDDLDVLAEELAQENAESYEEVATGWDSGWEDEEEKEAYYAEAYCRWEEIEKEEYEENKM